VVCLAFVPDSAGMKYLSITCTAGHILFFFSDVGLTNYRAATGSYRIDMRTKFCSKRVITYLAALDVLSFLHFFATFACCTHWFCCGTCMKRLRGESAAASIEMRSASRCTSLRELLLCTGCIFYCMHQLYILVTLSRISV
jgi:hypothetical protein